MHVIAALDTTTLLPSYSYDDITNRLKKPSIMNAVLPCKEPEAVVIISRRCITSVKQRFRKLLLALISTMLGNNYSVKWS
jgi:hypothetical protein